jgi:hemoglobin-like flavoprotein
VGSAFFTLEWKKKHESAAREIFLQHRLVNAPRSRSGANMMTRDQIRLVQASFRNVLPIREQAAALFYDRLFEIDPGTRGLFADTDLRSQGGKLMAAIGMVVHALDAPESMVEKLKELARRHVNYGVENRHYATVGAALLWTLQVGLGEALVKA